MSLWQKVRRLFDSSVEGVVGKARVFGTDSECLDDGLASLEEFVRDVGRITREHLPIDRVSVTHSEPSPDELRSRREEDTKWFVRFTSRDRTWSTWFDERDHTKVLDLVNRALHEIGAPRRVHSVSAKTSGQEFQLAYCTPDDVQSLLDREWIVDCASPHVEHVLEIGGLRVRGHAPWRLDDKGDLIEAVLASDQVVHQVPCMGGTEISITYEGVLTMATLAQDLGAGTRVFKRGCVISFSEDPGEIGDIELAGDHEVDGHPCASGTKVEFQSGGALRSLTLSRATTFERAPRLYRGREIPAGSTLTFAPDGSVESVQEPAGKRPPEPFDRPAAARPERATARGIVFAAREETLFTDEGELWRGTVADDCVVDGVPVRGGSRVRLHDGKLAEATLGSDHELPLTSGEGAPTATFAAGTKVVITSRGRVTEGTLAQDEVIGGLRCRGGAVFEPFSDGAVARCTLSAASEIGGVSIPAGAEVWLDHDGRPTHVALGEDGTFLGFDAIAGVCLELDPSRRAVRRVVLEPR